MRKMLLTVTLGAMSTALWAAGITPLKVKPGLWETSMTNTTSGQMGLPPEAAGKLTPEQRAKIEAAMAAQGAGGPRSSTHTNCVTEEDLNKDPFQDKNQMKDFKCDETVVQSTGSSLELHEVCSQQSSEFDAHVTLQALDSEHVKGAVQADITMGGRTMHQDMNFTSKRIAATCPADK